jgi:hypothetical protein
MVGGNIDLPVRSKLFIIVNKRATVTTALLASSARKITRVRDVRKTT